MTGLNAKEPPVKKAAGLIATHVATASVNLVVGPMANQDQKNLGVDLLQVVVKALKMRNYTWTYIK